MKILLAVSGSVSAYKTLDLTRNLTKEGHQVKVVLTKGAEQFVRANLFKYLGASEVYYSDDDFKISEIDAPVLHVELGNWSDIFIIAPLSANTLSRLAAAQASDLLTSIFLAYKKGKPLILFPAMNSSMLNHPLVQRNLSFLQKLDSYFNIFIHPTRPGELICKEIGEGKLPEVDVIQDIIESFPQNSDPINQQENLLISTGATVAPIDTVRYLTNSSSGITGYYLAKYALKQGRKVKVISGKYSTTKLNNLETHPNFEHIRVNTTSDMKSEVLKSVPEYPNYISSAAIGDFSFESSSNKKIKKEKMPENLKINREVDILDLVIKAKKFKKIVGFAAESSLDREMLTDKFKKKPVNLLVGTRVNNGLLNQSKVEGFSNLNAEYLILDSEENFTQKNMTKNQLAEYILQRISNYENF